ncbi:pseudouridine synthase [Vogesella sp. LIG4]|uniref:pseudouridine synthase n=1 Tax=Vogesella sp. LIG4 TaxID=1192162 RepID=UPI00081FB650|nr:pseudouridine synthase [Vogesella sp. LIG4]SCK17953.1 23S rRNA pseudouridine2605 synthase [Vogesella sp. LIG4]
MSKGQRNNSRQPLARVRGQESGQSRKPQAPRGPRALSPLNAPAAPAAPRAKPAANVGREQPQQHAPKRRRADGETAPAQLQHERRFGNKNAAMPAAASEQPGREFGEARRAPGGAPATAKPHAKVPRAKKLALRAPNQKVVDRSLRLRETRVEYDDIEPVRLQKALAASGVGSRREMEEWIEAGFVTVNGKRASIGDKVGPRDRVVVKGDSIKLKWADRLPRVIMYHKQEGEIVTRDDPGGRVTVFDRLPQAKSSRWVAIGRLDVNTSGLLLITTSGELANRMMHPSFEFDREYSVRVLGELTREQMAEMTKGVELEDGPAVFQRISEKGGAEDGANRWYNVVIREGRNREVRRMFEHFGLTVSRLIRVRFGNIGLPPRLKRGQYYELNEAEVAAVMKWAGLSATGQELPARGGKRAR